MWLWTLWFLLKGLGPQFAVSVGAGLLCSGIERLRARIRKHTTPDDILCLLKQEFPQLSRGIDQTWGQVFEARLDIEDLAGELQEVADGIQALKSRQDTDKDTVDVLVTKTHELFGLVEREALRGEEADAEVLEAVREVRRRFIPARHTVIRDLDGPEGKARLMAALDLHPGDIDFDDLLPRPDLRKRVPSEGNVLITGLPGAGKTTLIYQTLVWDKPEAVVVLADGFGSEPDDLRHLLADDLPENPCVVYDNIQRSAAHLLDSMRAVLHRWPKARLLTACRTGDLDRIRNEAAGFREALDIRHTVPVPALQPDEAEELVALCERNWGIAVEKDLRDWFLERAGRRYATPFYYISLLAPVRGRDDRVAQLTDVLRLPEDALASIESIWQEYFRRLEKEERRLLRSLRIVGDMDFPTDPAMVGLIAENVFDLARVQQSEALEKLERHLWVSRTETGTLSSYDVQMSVAQPAADDYKRLPDWLEAYREDSELAISLLNSAANMFRVASARAGTAVDYRQRNALGARVTGEGLQRSRQTEDIERTAMFANNLSLFLSGLAGAASDAGERRDYLDQGVEVIEEAVEIRRALNLPADLAMSLHNASAYYSELGGAASDAGERRDYLARAVEAIGEAVEIRRRLNLPADLAGSLNNASVHYSGLAGAASDAGERRADLERAVEAIEEAVKLYRALDLPAYLAHALNNASRCYSELAGAASDAAERRDYLEQAVEVIEEAVKIRRRLNLPADLASSLNSASVHYSGLAGAASDAGERRKHLGKAVKAIEEAVQIHRALEGRESLGMALGTLTNVRQAFADAATGADEGAEWMGRAAESIDEAIGIFENVGVTRWLLQAYPQGCEVHEPLAVSGGKKSVAKLCEYAKKAAELLAAFDRHAEAESFAEIVRRIEEGGVDALLDDGE